MRRSKPARAFHPTRRPARPWGLYSFVPVAVVVGLCGVAAAGEIYRIDPVHTWVLFRIQHLGISYAYGRFRDVSGTLDLDEAAPERSSMRVEIGVDSIDTDNEKRDRHLRSADFFDASKFPRITFRSTALRKVEDQTFDVTGNLSMHGVTKPATLRMKLTGVARPDPWGDHRAGFEGTTTIRRSDFNMNAIDAGAFGALGDDVQVTIAVEAVRR